MTKKERQAYEAIIYMCKTIGIANFTNVINMIEEGYKINVFTYQTYSQLIRYACQMLIKEN